VSIITNTNWQSCGGESPLSNFRQTGAITSNRSRVAPPLQDSQANHNRPYL
jgi:K+-transporting ATPase A subunit